MTLSPKAEAYIAARVAAAPPFSPEQRDKLALLLRPEKPAIKPKRRKAA